MILETERLAPAVIAAEIARRRPRTLYLIDVGRRTVAAGLVARMRRIPFVLDTGDVVFELERSRGGRSHVGLAAVWAGERFLVDGARAVVVRGRAHVDLLRPRPALFAPDLAPPHARPLSGARVRERLGLRDAFVVGLVGSLNRAPRLGVTYGADVVGALSNTSPHIAALVVGDGDARPALEHHARELGVADRCHFVGFVPTHEVAEWIGAMDVAVSTQTNDMVGAVRTTGKLPLYLACGCPVLASDVGEARRLLGPLGWTLPYHGVVDKEYPRRLAKAIEQWANDPAGAQLRRRQALALHHQAFDPDAVRARVRALVDGIVAEA